MATRPPDLHHSAYAQGINRGQSAVLAYALPWLSIMLGTLAPGILSIASAPLFPPIGFLMLVSWRQLRPGLLPVWVGLPLGLFDDLYSGQPFGSAVLLWSATMIIMEVVELGFPWRSFIVDWLMASAIIVLYLLLALGLANAGGGHVLIAQILPQVLFAMLVFPLVGRLVGFLDRARLARFRTFK